MDPEVQAIMIRLMGAEELAKLYPCVLHAHSMLYPSSLTNSQKDLVRQNICRNDGLGWYCTRERNHTGPHIRHKLNPYEEIPPLVWINEKG